MDFIAHGGEQRYAALVRMAATTVIALDFDGTLAPIVDDPDAARIHPDACDVLVDLAARVAGVAVITGRPAAQVLEMGDFDALADAIASVGRDLFVFGQYGNERWSSAERRIVGSHPPAGLADFESDLPEVLARLDAHDAFVEHKGLAVAIHTRRLDDRDDVFHRVLPELRQLAKRHDLSVEPGKNVVEVRGSGTHKGDAVRRLVTDLNASGFAFAGDDLGDVEAFEALGELEPGGLSVLRISSDPAPRSPLRPLVDLVVDGPDGVLDFLRRFTEDVRALDH